MQVRLVKPMLISNTVKLGLEVTFKGYVSSSSHDLYIFWSPSLWDPRTCHLLNYSHWSRSCTINQTHSQLSVQHILIDSHVEKRTQEHTSNRGSHSRFTNRLWSSDNNRSRNHCRETTKNKANIFEFQTSSQGILELECVESQIRT